jgi:hypothetical protein
MVTTTPWRVFCYWCVTCNNRKYREWHFISIKHMLGINIKLMLLTCSLHSFHFVTLV